MVQVKDVIHIADDTASYRPSAAARLGGARSIVSVPMFKEDALVGVINIYRQEVRPFTDKQIELVRNFAAQAVIAIENARLLNELRQSLEQQTATSDVLSVISSSRGELQPVFDSILANATRLCDAKFGVLQLCEDGGFRLVAAHNPPPAYIESRRKAPVIRPGPLTPPARVATTKQLVHIADMMEEPAYKEGDPAAMRFVDMAGVRTLLVVPMLKDGELLGELSIFRQEVGPFTDKQISLVKNFAAQAVIAIENARLLKELRESLEGQTATSNILRAIASSPGDVEGSLRKIAETTARLFGAVGVSFRIAEGDVLRLSVGVGQGAEQISEALYAHSAARLTVGGRNLPGTVIRESRQIQLPDLDHLDDEFADWPGPPIARRAGIRTMVGTPLRTKSGAIGALIVYRNVLQPFEAAELDLLQSFADQAVIAIENARLFEAEQQRTRELGKSLDDLRTAQDRLVQTEKLASLGQLTAGIAHEIKNPLNFVNNFSGVSVELIDELREALLRASADDKTRAEIDDLANTLRDNLGKIAQHGKRADSIVKNMLMHSREGSGELRPVDINALVDEALNLAYHGARAEKQGFNIALERSFDPAAGKVEAFPQEITRVLLNLISNGFYAAMKRQSQEGNNGFEPTIRAATKGLGDRVEITIRDNGTGIPPEVREKMFNPFFTTKPAGEGTGLGLSISHDIIVKQHLGSIEVETALGEFTEFRIILPRSAA